MDTFFVKDLLRWNYFHNERKSFYSEKEKKLNLPILFFVVFALNFYFFPYLFSFISTFFYHYFIFIFFLFFLIAIIGFFIFYNEHRSLRILLFPLIILSISILNNFISVFFVQFSDLVNLDFFSFLFVRGEIPTYNNNEIFVKLRIANFVSFWINLFFLCFCAFVMRDKIIKKIKSINNYFLSFTCFSFFIIAYVFFFFNFQNVGQNNLGIFGRDFLSQNQQNIIEIYNLNSEIGKFFFIINLIFLGPISEELFFRYAVFVVFGRSRVWWAIFFSTFWFAFAHFHTSEFINESFFSLINKVFYSNLSFYFYSAFALSFVYYFYKLNLIYPIIFHIFINFIVSLPWVMEFF